MRKRARSLAANAIVSATSEALGSSGENAARVGALEELWMLLGEARAAHESHRHRERADAVGAAFVGAGAGQHVESALGDRVGRFQSLPTDVGRVARHVDDHAAARVAHPRHHRAAQIPRAGQVHAQAPVPVGRVVVEDAAHHVDRRIVHEDLHAPELARDLRDDAVDLRAIARIEHVTHDARLRMLGLDRRGDLARAALVDVRHDDDRAACREPARGRLADAGSGGGGDQRDPAAELAHPESRPGTSSQPSTSRQQRSECSISGNEIPTCVSRRMRMPHRITAACAVDTRSSSRVRTAGAARALWSARNRARN